MRYIRPRPLSRPRNRGMLAVFIVGIVALVSAGTIACGSEPEPQPDPREVVANYISANGQSLVASLAEQLINLNASLEVVPESDLVESIGAGIAWDVADVEFQDDQAVVTNVAAFSFTVSTGQTPNVKITATATAPFLFYVRGTEVLRFVVPVDQIDLDLDTSIAF